MNEEIDMRKCVICNEPIADEGSEFHRDCYREVMNEVYHISLLDKIPRDNKPLFTELEPC